MRFLALQPRAACLEEQRSLREIFQQHAPFVWRSLRHLGVPLVDLEDLMQEAFVVVHARLATYEERDRLRSWLYAICMRLALAHKRKAASRRETLTAEPPEIETAPTQHARLEQQEALALGERLLAVLTESQRAVFFLYEIEHQGMPEVAAALGCPIQTAYARLHKARERVQGELKRLRARGEVP